MSTLYHWRVLGEIINKMLKFKAHMNINIVDKNWFYIRCLGPLNGSNINIHDACMHSLIMVPSQRKKSIYIISYFLSFHKSTLPPRPPFFYLQQWFTFKRKFYEDVSIKNTSWSITLAFHHCFWCHMDMYRCKMVHLVQTAFNLPSYNQVW